MTMSQRTRRLLLLGLCAVAGFAAAAGDADSTTSHGIVRIGDGAVRPSVLKVARDDRVFFFNDSDSVAQLVFDADARRRAPCLDSRPDFYERGDGRLASRPIDELEFGLPCELPPGAYRYEVWLSHGVVGGGGLPVDDDVPEYVLHGEIQVD